MYKAVTGYTKPTDANYSVELDQGVFTCGGMLYINCGIVTNAKSTSWHTVYDNLPSIAAIVSGDINGLRWRVSSGKLQVAQGDTTMQIRIIAFAPLA